MKICTSDIAKIISGTLKGPGDLFVSDIVTDSRQLFFSEGQVFIAINGKNHDGHLFIPSLYKAGIRIFIVERVSTESAQLPDASFIIVKDTVAALQLLATYKRKLFKSPVIAVTGSAGKTVVKEWLADILGISTPVVRSPKSYNSQIGVPLSVWKLEDKYRLGIFEAGISMPGEMDKLQSVINPDIGVITNIGDAHRENFQDEKAKAGEKLKLFKDASVIVYCRDHSIVHQLLTEHKNTDSRKLFDWSLKDKSAKIFVTENVLKDDHTNLHIFYSGKESDFTLPFSDRASIENAITVASVCLAMGVERDTIKKGLEGLVAVAMRMEVKSGINNCQLIEDYYNSDPGSLGMAIDYLRKQKGRKKTLILSDFIQNGREERDLYGEVANLVKSTDIEKFIGIGDALVRNKFLFGDGAQFFSSTSDFLSGITTGEFADEIILIKGARVFEFERIGQVLELQVHQTVLEISLDAIAHNLNEIRRFLKHDTRIMAMVKAFAYGAGPAEISSLLEYQGVSYLGVAYADEGIELRNAGVTMPVMVMNPDPNAFELMIKYNLEPELYSFYSLKQFTSVASKHALINYPVHIKIDTGMHRLGFLPDEIADLALNLKDLECIRVISVFSHLAGSEDSALDIFTLKQVSLFQQAVTKIKDSIGYSFLCHILNTSGIVRFPQYQFDMVRPGIGMYGVGHFEGLHLKTAGRFKTKISQIKTVRKGEPVGYGCMDVSDNVREIAILPVGYADGLNRQLGNRRGSLFIKEVKVPIIGNICMDMCMADISGIMAKIGDEAEIFGNNISIEEIAEKCQTIPYEILTSVPSRVKRVFFRE